MRWVPLHGGSHFNMKCLWCWDLQYTVSDLVLAAFIFLYSVCCIVVRILVLLCIDSCFSVWATSQKKIAHMQ